MNRGGDTRHARGRAGDPSSRSPSPRSRERERLTRSLSQVTDSSHRPRGPGRDTSISGCGSARPRPRRTRRQGDRGYSISHQSGMPCAVPALPVPRSGRGGRRIGIPASDSPAPRASGEVLRTSRLRASASRSSASAFAGFSDDTVISIFIVRLICQVQRTYTTMWPLDCFGCRSALF